MNRFCHKKTFQELTTDERYELSRVRSEVFVVEQNCVYQDIDGDDQKSIHLWLIVADKIVSEREQSDACINFAEREQARPKVKIVALARVCPAGTHMKEISIGRVIITERGKGYGKQIMLHVIEAAVEQFSATFIDTEAQEYARGFYESVGFRQSSDTFMLDGIPHISIQVIAHIPHILPMPKGNQNLYIQDANGNYIHDDFRHELALYVDGVLFTGSAHSGLENILVVCPWSVHTVVGGFHLLDGQETNDEIKALAQRLKANYPETLFYTSHCTGDKVFEVMKGVMGEQLQSFRCGTLNEMK